jgi:hypothetical protein
MRGARPIAVVVALALAAAACKNGEVVPPKGGAAVKGVVRAKPRRGADVVSADYSRQRDAPERIDYRSLQGIVVWVEGADLAPVRSEVATVTLEKDRFVPDVVTLSTADQLEVRNASGAAATLFADGLVDETACAAGATARLRPTKAGTGLLVVEELDAPKLHVLVAPTRHHKVLASGDDFAFELPRPGDYVVKAWHWRLPPSEQAVHADADRVAEVELVLSVNTLRK